MTPTAIKEARLRLGLSRAQFALHLGVSARTVEEWERENNRHGVRPIPYLDRAIRDLERELTEAS